MKIELDTADGTMRVAENGSRREISIYTPEAFELLSKEWLKVGWGLKHIYTFTWMGRPVIQLPEDLLRIQELIYRVRPDVLIETGIAHGGSLIYYASLFKAMSHGRVIGIDIDIRAHNRKAIEAHPLFPYLTLVEGDSISPQTIERVSTAIGAADTVLVVLDGNHTKEHVLAELEAYSSFVSEDSYIIAADGIMEYLPGAPRSKSDWSWNNPRAAAREFADRHPEFVIEQPRWEFNESLLLHNVTHWPDGYLRRIKANASHNDSETP